MEQIASSTWRDAIEDCVKEAIEEKTQSGLPDDPQSETADGLSRQQCEDQLADQAAAMLPPVAPGEVVSAMMGVGAQPSEAGLSSVPTPSGGNFPTMPATLPSPMASSRASTLTRLDPVIDRAKAADSRFVAEKRPADVGVRDLEDQHASEPLQRLVQRGKHF